MDELIGEYEYGIYDKRRKDMHRTGMSLIEAAEWLKDAEETFPAGVAQKIWGVARCQWTVL